MLMDSMGWEFRQVTACLCARHWLAVGLELEPRSLLSYVVAGAVNWELGFLSA